MAGRSLLRTLTLAVLALAVGGFGLCALCGGVIGVSSLSEGRASSREIAWLAFGLSGLGALLAGGCWWGFQALRRPPAAAADAPADGSPPA